MKIYKVDFISNKINSQYYGFCENCRILIKHDGRKNPDLIEYHNPQEDAGYTYLYGDKRFINEPYIYCPECSNKIVIKGHDIGKSLIIDYVLRNSSSCTIM